MSWRKCYKKNVSSCQRKQLPDITCEALLRTIVTPRRYAKSATACIISSLLVKIMAKSSLVKKITFMKRTPRRRDWNMVMSGDCLLMFSISWVFYYHSLIQFQHLFIDISIGVAIGSGWQVMVAFINLACYYIVGLPIGYFLGFKQHLGVKVRIFLL